MENPTFNRKQQKTTLSAKKKKSAQVKHVLAAPQMKNNNSQLSLDDQKTLLNCLEKNLPRIKEDTIRVPYSAIKNVSVEKRKEFRENYYKHQGVLIDKTESKGLVIGINNVTKILETNSACAVLISNDVKPKVMTDHIYNLAALRMVPLLVIPNLRKVLKEKCGISGTCMALKKDITVASNKLYLLQQDILTVAQNYPIPESNLNCTLNESCIIINDDQEIRSISNKQVAINHAAIRSKTYLKRNSRNQRVFKPPISEEIGEPMEVDVPELLPKNNRVKLKAKYTPLKVKALKGDPNRNKRKINQLKMSKKDKKKKKKRKII